MSTNDTHSGRHPVNIGHLVMGLAFLLIVGIWALVQTDTVTGDDVRWLLPIPWVVAGAVGLAVTAVTGSRRYAVRQVGWVGQPEPAPAPAPVAEEPPLHEPVADEPAIDEPVTDEPVADEPVTDEPAVEETAPITAQPDLDAAEHPENPENPENPEEKP